MYQFFPSRSSHFFFVVFALLIEMTVSGCSKPIDKVEDVRPVRAITLTASQQQVMAEYSGSVQARVESRLAFRVGGKILTRSVDVGSLVKPGQVLMQLDLQDLRLAQSQAQANLNSAQSQLKLATFEFQRYQELRKTNAISQSAMDAKITALDAAKATAEQAQDAFTAQKHQTEYATLFADVEGVVTAINAEVGQVVAPGMAVVQVAQLHAKSAGELEVVVGVPENNLDVVTRADKISIHLWANPKEIIEGKLREVSPVADPATRTFLAKVSVVNPTPKQVALIKLGMTASVQFSLQSANAFVKVPLTSLYQEKGVTSVWIVENGSVKLVPVQVGGVSGNDILLTSGVTAGQIVVTAGVHVLNPGQHVSVMPQEVKPVSQEPYISAQTFLLPAKNANSSASKGAVK